MIYGFQLLYYEKRWTVVKMQYAIQDTTTIIWTSIS